MQRRFTHTRMKLRPGPPAGYDDLHALLGTPEQVAEAIGTPVLFWPGNCYGISKEIADEGLVPGARAVYGHWYGTPAPGSMFDRDTPFVQHGWLRLPGDIIIDPTEWVMHGLKETEAYLWIGRNNGAYDEGGQRLRAALMGDPPTFDPKDTQVTIPHRALTPSCWGYLCGLVGHDAPYTVGQMIWVASLPVDVLGGYAQEMYRALAESGNDAFIPIDNWRLVMQVPV